MYSQKCKIVRISPAVGVCVWRDCGIRRRREPRGRAHLSHLSGDTDSPSVSRLAGRLAAEHLHITLLTPSLGAVRALTHVALAASRPVLVGGPAAMVCSLAPRPSHPPHNGTRARVVGLSSARLRRRVPPRCIRPLTPPSSWERATSARGTPRCTARPSGRPTSRTRA